jgi:hypothetical protein
MVMVKLGASDFVLLPVMVEVLVVLLDAIFNDMVVMDCALYLGHLFLNIGHVLGHFGCNYWT